MRYDMFILWGNGINYVSSIVNMIRDDKNFSIIRMVLKDIHNMQEFIRGVYKCDTVPWEHLVAKSRYLLSAEKKCICILVKNKNPEEKHFGEGRFRHIQCQKIINIKNLIRSKYNPKLLDLNRIIPPLPQGVSHNHCIHATDYESQVDYLLGYFNLGTLSSYNRYENSPVYIPWHLNINNYEIVALDLNNLRANVNGNIIKIEDTPHYQYVLGNKDAYINYFYKNFGKILQEDHFPESFDRLIQNFDVNYKTPSGKKSHIIVQKNTIRDGLHRASILKHLGIKKIKCIQIS